MRRWVYLAACAGLLAACTAGTEDPSRDVFGVSAARPAAAGTSAPDAQVSQVLAWHIAQICTRGHELLKQDFDEAEASLQLVDQQVRCRPYRFSLF